MTLIAFDRRADHVVVNRSASLDALNDIDALAQDSRGYLERAHVAHCDNHWANYLFAVDRINRNVIRIRDIAHEACGRLNEAPVVSPDQLAIWNASGSAAA